MWKKGEADDEGYFTIINSHSKKVLTAISEHRLEIKGKPELWLAHLFLYQFFNVFLFTIDPLKLEKVQRDFYLGHGIKTNDPKEAARIFLQRDHDKLLALLLEYHRGKLGVYMVPCMFFGQVPEAIDLSKKEKALTLPAANNVLGDIAERKVFYALKEYFTLTGDDVLIIHSHKFLQKGNNREKDFIIFNLSKGKYFYWMHTIDNLYK